MVRTFENHHYHIVFRVRRLCEKIQRERPSEVKNTEDAGQIPDGLANVPTPKNWF